MDPAPVFRILAPALLLGMMVAGGRHRVAADRRGGRMPRSADPLPIRIGLALGAATFLGGLLLFVIHPPVLERALVSVPSPARWAGAAMVVAGGLLAERALAHLGRNVTPTALPRSDATLVTSGPYRHVRHPLYTSGMLSLPGFALLTGSWPVAAGGFLALLTLAVRTRREERLLVERFGDAYRTYAARTPRYLPRIRW